MARRKKVVEEKKVTEEIPPGATKKAFDRPMETGGGPPGSAAGPRHASDDEGTENEEFGRTEITKSPASPLIEDEDELEQGPPFSGAAGGAVGGTPAQLRSAERSAAARKEPQRPDPLVEKQLIPTSAEREMKRLTGFLAIEYAEKQGLSLNKHPDSVDGPRTGLSVAEATAIADEDEDLIWLDIAEQDYRENAPTSYQPER